MGCWEVILNHTCQALKAQEALHAHQLFCLRNNPLLSREMGLTGLSRRLNEIMFVKLDLINVSSLASPHIPPSVFLEGHVPWGQ